jgi:hypothetical protein
MPDTENAASAVQETEEIQDEATPIESVEAPADAADNSNEDGEKPDEGKIPEDTRKKAKDKADVDEKDPFFQAKVQSRADKLTKPIKEKLTLLEKENAELKQDKTFRAIKFEIDSLYETEKEDLGEKKAEELKKAREVRAEAYKDLSTREANAKEVDSKMQVLVAVERDQYVREELFKILVPDMPDVMKQIAAYSKQFKEVGNDKETADRILAAIREKHQGKYKPAPIGQHGGGIDTSKMSAMELIELGLKEQKQKK